MPHHCVNLNHKNRARRVTTITDNHFAQTPPPRKGVIFYVFGGIQAQADTDASGATAGNTGIYGMGGTIGVEGHGTHAGVRGVADGETDGWAIVGDGGQAGRFGGDVWILGDLRIGNAHTWTDNGIEYDAYLHCSANLDGCVEDYGRASLTKGMAIVQFRQDFLQMADTSGEYNVFLTPLGDCNGLYLDQNGLDPIDPAYFFIVRELQKGQSNIEFAYHIVAPRIINKQTISAPRDNRPVE